MSFSLTEQNIKGRLRVKNFESTLDSAKKIVSNICIPEEITDEETKRSLTRLRADLNRIIKEIDTRRISIVKELTEDFETDCKTIKTIFEETQEEIGKKLSEYKAKVAQTKIDDTKTAEQFSTTEVTIVITSSEALSALTKFCNKNNYKIKEKREVK